jgi:hypothetical protein
MVVCGQTINVQGGDSSLFEASGGSIKAYMPDGSVTTIGGGSLDGHVLLGGNVSRNFDGYNLTAGDLSLPFALPTDSYAGYGFMGRGVLIRPGNSELRKFGTYSPIKTGLIGSLAGAISEIFSHCAIFAGVSSVSFGVPFFQANRADEPLGYLNCKDHLTDHWTLYSQDAFSDRQTALVSLGYQNNGFGIAWTAGIGSNTAFGAVLGKYENQSKTFAAKVGYTSVQDEFHRVLVSSPLVSENSGLNYDLAWIPKTGLRLNATHQRVLSPVTNLPSVAATIDTEGIFYQLGRMNFRAANYSSTAAGVKNSGQDYGSDFKIVNGIVLRAEYLRSRQSEVLISSIQETVRRFQFTQNVTESTSQGKTQTSFDGGVSYHGSALTASLEFEELYFPYSLPGQSAFRRVLMLSFQRQIKDAVLAGQTFVDPNGHLKFTAQGSDYIYGPKPVERSGTIQPHRSMGKYVVRGVVTDQQNRSVYGAVVQVDGEAVYTGFDGRFFIRFRKPGTFPVCIPTNHFMEGNWLLVSAPASATAKLEDQADFIVIVVERQ